MQRSNMQQQNEIEWRQHYLHGWSPQYRNHSHSLILSHIARGHVSQRRDNINPNILTAQNRRHSSRTRILGPLGSGQPPHKQHANGLRERPAFLYENLAQSRRQFGPITNLQHIPLTHLSQSTTCSRILCTRHPILSLSHVTQTRSSTPRLNLSL